MNKIIHVPTTQELESIRAMALSAAESKVFDLKLKEEKMNMLMLTGLSLGINPILAPNYIYEFNGKFGLLTKTMLGLIHKSGELHSMNSGYIEENGKQVGRWVEMTRRNPGGEPLYHREQFTIQEAKDAGIYNKDNWKYPLRMCYWRAASWCASVLFSHVIGGMMTTEEIGMNHDNSGMPVINNLPRIESPVDVNAEFQQIILEHGPRIVFPALKDNKPPQTEEGLEALRDYLSKFNGGEEDAN